jgi:ferredoxin
MLVDLDEYFRPVLNLCDAVLAMEGNGPTQGTPKQIGCLLASKDSHCLDVLAATLIGLTPKDVPTLAAAIRRGLCPDSVEGLSIAGDYRAFLQKDFEIIRNRNSHLFVGGDNLFGRTVRGAMNQCLESRPKVKKHACVGCGKCRDICPAHAISIVDKKAVIDRKHCIKCFCCQEFCPVGAMRVHRASVAALLTHGKRGTK